MKMQVLGVKRIVGTSKTTGNPFDMCRLFGMVPVENVSKATLQITGAGFELAEIELDPEALPSFLAQKFPVLLDLETDSRPFMGKFETVVSGIKAAPSVRAA